MRSGLTLFAMAALVGCGQAPRESADTPALAGERVAIADIAPVATVSAFDANKAHFDYQMNCQGCHGPKGAGSAKRQVPPLEKLDHFLALREGREFLIRVPGMARSPLSDADLTNLANWMLVEFSEADWNEPSEPYSVAEVTRLRNDPIVDGVVEHRAKLVARLGAESEPTT